MREEAMERKSKSTSSFKKILKNAGVWYVWFGFVVFFGDVSCSFWKENNLQMFLFEMVFHFWKGKNGALLVRSAFESSELERKKMRGWWCLG